MLSLSPKAYTAIVILLSVFLLATGSVYVLLLAYMAIHSIDATGVALQKLELFVIGNLGLLIGTIFKPSSTNNNT